MIGLSGGAWAEVVANHPQLDELVVVEINQGYLKIIPSYPVVADLLANPRVKIVLDDGRRWLRNHCGQGFDVVLMNTTFHWRSFASNVLSVEFLRAPFLGVELVEQLGGLRMLQPSVTHQLTHVGPVLLLDARVVVFAIGPRAGEAHRVPAAREIV